MTDVFPTRVTYQTKVTVIGTGFDSTSLSNLTCYGMSIQNKTLVSSIEMTFTIGKNSYDDDTQDLIINSVDTMFDIDYVGSTLKILKNGNESTVTKITEIYTKLEVNGSSPVFWRSTGTTDPDNSHDLIGFKFNGIVYSTGVDDDMLTTNLSSEIDITSTSEYVKQDFRAYSTNGISGNVHSSNYIVTGDWVDGIIGEGSTTINSNVIKGLTAYDVITDGVNGLDLGTGITNFNQTASIKFFSGNGQPGAIGDDIPDLLISQIAQPGGTDVYYYADEEGNVVGRPIKLQIVDQGSGDALLTNWDLDLFNMYSGSYATSTPKQYDLNSYYTSYSETRPLRMVALKLEDFGISGDSSNSNAYVGNVNNINMMAGGSSDMAFLAYNKSAFEIKAPVADALLPRYVCRLPSTTDITFSVSADVDGGGTGSSSETLTYEWSKYNEDLSVSGTSLTINNVKEDDLATYNVRVYNDFGSIIVPVTLEQGGTPTAWDGTSWSVPSAYSSAGITISDEDKSLIFYDDYNKALDLEGCDCTVKAGTNVVIPSGQTLKLYDDLIVEPYQAAYTDSDGNTISAVSAGSFTLKNNASLVQIKDTEGNINEGVINIERLADNLHASDYVYWSSPVEDFYVTGIPNSRIYKWDPTEANAKGTTGDWVYVSSEIMGAGEGYIVRVPSASSFTTSFNGRPNNATIDVAVKKSTGTMPAEESRHFNLIGNPYPSSINTIKFLTDNEIIEGHVSLWMHNSEISNTETSSFYEDYGYNYGDQYVVYNATGATPANAFDGNIASGQAFFVKVDDSKSNGNVTFTNDMRYDATESSYDNSEFFRSADETETTSLEKQLVWLSLINSEDVSVSTLVGYLDGATNEKDRMFDAYINDDAFKIYSLISDRKIVIQGRALPFLNEDEVPLGIDVSTDGIYKIGIDNLEGSIFLDESQDIYLRDTYLNVEHNLKESAYSFTAVAGATKDRFVLIYEPTSSVLSVDDEVLNNTFVYIKQGTLYVKSAENIETIQVYDISGKQLINYTPKTQTNQLNRPFAFSKGGYIIAITLDEGHVVTKKLIN